MNKNRMMRRMERLTAQGLMIVFTAMVLGSFLAPPVSAATMSVTIVDFSFQPSTLVVNPGDTVTWTNTGTYAHTVTSDTAVFGSGQLSTGQTFSYTFNTVGNYPYHCSNHPYMTATIQVGAIPEFPGGIFPLMILFVIGFVLMIGRREKSSKK